MTNLILPIRVSLLLAVVSSSTAQPLTIANPSFENWTVAPDTWTGSGVGLTGWTITGSAAGVFRPANAAWFTRIPDGVNTAWSHGQTISQVLNDVLIAGGRYTLEVEIGDCGCSPYGGYAVELWAGSTLLASDSAVLPEDTCWSTSRVVYNSPSGDPLAGQALQIRLLSGGLETNFDDVRLTRSARSVTIVNASFESLTIAPDTWTGSGVGLTGWNTTGSASGVFRPASAAWFTRIPDGVNTAWSHGQTISQVLNDVLIAGDRYTLEVEIGNCGCSPYGGYAVELWAGNTLLGRDNAAIPTVISWSTSRVVYNSPPGDPLAGQALEIRLLSGGLETNFDDVRLTRSASTGTYTYFGGGCGSCPPELTAPPSSVPSLGTTFTVNVSSLPSNPVVNVPFMMLGYSRSSLPLDSIGMSGCTLLVGNVGGSFTLNNSGGSATWQLTLPSNTSLLGTSFYNQCFVLAPGANPLGLIASNGGVGTIGQ